MQLEMEHTGKESAFTVYGCRSVGALMRKAFLGAFDGNFTNLSFTYHKKTYVLRENGRDLPDAKQHLDMLESMPLKQLLFENVQHVTIDGDRDAGCIFVIL